MKIYLMEWESLSGKWGIRYRRYNLSRTFMYGYVANVNSRNNDHYWKVYEGGLAVALASSRRYVRSGYVRSGYVTSLLEAQNNADKWLKKLGYIFVDKRFNCII